MSHRVKLCERVRTEIEKIDLTHWESIWFYTCKVDLESDLSATMYDGAVSNGPTRLALNFIDLDKAYDRVV